jgi:TP901 family phage tail tape measure protein
MALNNLGLGFLFTAKDLASGVMADVKHNLHEVGEEGEKVVHKLKDNFAEFVAGLGLLETGLKGFEMFEPAVEAADAFRMKMLQVSSLVSESEIPMREMEELVDGLAARFGVMPVEQAKGLYTAIRQGARDAESAQSLLTAGTALSVASQTELGQSIQTVSRIAKVFNLDMAESGQVADKLFIASRRAEDGVSGIAEVLQMVGPDASRAGLDMNDLLAVMMQMDAAGIHGRHGIGGLRDIILGLIKPSADAKAEAARLGIAFDEQTLAAEGLPGLLQAVAQNTHLNSQSLEKLFGSTEAATVAMGLMRNGGADLAARMRELAGAHDAASQAAEKLITEQQRFNVLSDQSWTIIGKSLLPVKDAIFGTLNAFLEGFNKTNPGIIRFVTLTVLVVSGISVLVGSVAAASAGFTILSAASAALGISFAGTAAMIWSALWPALLVIGALGLAFAAVKIAYDQNLGGFGDKVREVWGEVKLAFTALEELFSGGGFTDGTWQELEKHSGIRDFAISVWGWVQKIENFFRGIGAGFIDHIKFVHPLLDSIGRAIYAIVDALGLFSTSGANSATVFDMFGGAGYAVGHVLGVVFDALMLVVSLLVGVVRVGVANAVGLFQMLRSIISGVVDVFYGLAEIIGGIAHGSWKEAWHGMKVVAFGVIDGILGTMLSFASSFGGVIDAIAGVFGKKLNLQKTVLDFKDGLHNAMASDFGVTAAVGLRSITGSTETGLGAISVGGSAPADNPLVAPAGGEGGAGETSMPAVAAAEAGAPTGSSDLSAISSHLENISKNTEGGGPPININVVLDSEVIGRAVARSNRNAQTRGFEPAPAPG